MEYLNVTIEGQKNDKQKLQMHWFKAHPKILLKLISISSCMN